jgi:hypothetical protein
VLEEKERKREREREREGREKRVKQVQSRLEEKESGEPKISGCVTVDWSFGDQRRR